MSLQLEYLSIASGAGMLLWAGAIALAGPDRAYDYDPGRQSDPGPRYRSQLRPAATQAGN